MKVEIFISHPTPHNQKQKDFLKLIESELKKTYNFSATNLGKNNWNFESPLKPIKEIISKCSGVVIIGLEREHCVVGYEKQGSKDEREYFHKYKSSSWIQIEAGMAYQLGIPLLILKEKKLEKDGILNPLTSEYYVYEFDMDKIQLSLPKEIKTMMRSWAKTIKEQTNKK